jgi:hypothetical protein
LLIMGNHRAVMARRIEPTRASDFSIGVFHLGNINCRR